MIITKNEEQLHIMRHSGRILSDVFKCIEDNIREGITTKQLDTLCHELILKNGATPSFLNYNGYPASICTSIDEEVVHGIPSSRRLEKGQIVGIDIGVFYNGYHSDAARTYEIGTVSEDKHRLAEVTRESFYAGIDGLSADSRLGDLGYKIQTHVEKNGMSVVRSLVGHGIGSNLHEDPSVPNYGNEGRGLRLKAGMTIAVEPMVNMGHYDVVIAKDGWTVITKDRLPSAHYENTLIVLSDGVELITV